MNAETRRGLRRLEKRCAGGPPDLTTWTDIDLHELAAVLFAIHVDPVARQHVSNNYASFAALNEVLVETMRRDPVKHRDALWRWVRDSIAVYRAMDAA